ncbi:hypothetical protein BJP36_43870 [Moorena producens JHB]|uniref:Uncharacterized protein n=1 Tax=Moorena producens (strain JHB) TaxID=1454205 RepID=A0A9Q9STE1_MOOP1|nr:hypothetical protein [Moorena producens]WAN69297.1 hypothetical protein BJP36_43870 [Moorena producens JHB]
MQTAVNNLSLIPTDLFPVPCSLFPIPSSLFSLPYSLFPKKSENSIKSQIAIIHG